MKIAVAQTKPVKGDIESNIISHQKFINLASANNADLIIFPELSLTSYEPGLSKELAIDEQDSRLNVFQTISDTKHITIGVGIPTKSSRGICISMLLFQPKMPQMIYSKQFIHPDEETFFVCGKKGSGLIGDKNIALAICYELSVPEHSETAFKNGANIYVASVAKSAVGVEKAFDTLASIAKKYAITVLLANSVGPSDDFVSAGRSAIWNSKGTLLDELDSENEGLLILNTNTQEVTKVRVNHSIL